MSNGLDKMLRARVAESLRNSLDNGEVYTRDTHPMNVVNDLRDFDADLENVSVDQLLPVVEEWLGSYLDSEGL